MINIWRWAGFDKDRKFICDAGVVYAGTVDEAYTSIMLAIGGPYVERIAFIEIELAAKGYKIAEKEKKHFKIPMARMLTSRLIQ